jgi:alpha-beta hydrolase superfamily lysophospholipase
VTVPGAASGVAAEPPVTVDVRAADGTRLVERTWRPRADVARAGSMLLVHGVGEHAMRYAHVASTLTALGIVVRAYDQRGFGASDGRRGAIPHDDALLDDARDRYDALARAMQAEGDGRAPFVLGHSMGGCVVARAVTGGWIAAPRAMVLSSPGLVPRINAAERLAARVGGRLVPNVQIPHGLPLDRLSHDPAVEASVRSDPLAHDRVTPRLVRFMLEAGERAIADAARCRVPTLLLVAGEEDRFVRPDGARRFHAALPAGVGTLREYPELWHEVLQERASDRERVLADLVAWLRPRLGG